jgi:hypothetical protein
MSGNYGACIRFRSLVAFACLAIAGCAPGTVERKWSEQVELDDGKVINVDREVEFKESNSWAGDAYSSTTLRSSIKFRDDLSTLPEWNSTLMPLVVYQDKNTSEWVVVASSTRSLEWAARGKPVPPYWEYRAKTSGWLEVPLSIGSIGRKTNLYVLYEKPLPAEMLSVAEKMRYHKDSLIAPRYLSVQGSVEGFEQK